MGEEERPSEGWAGGSDQAGSGVKQVILRDAGCVTRQAMGLRPTGPQGGLVHSRAPSSTGGCQLQEAMSHGPPHLTQSPVVAPVEQPAGVLGAG